MLKKPGTSKLIFLIVAALALLAAFGLWAFFGSTDEPQDPTERYRITTTLDAEAIDRMVDVMRQEPEFAFYFSVLDERAQRPIRQEAASIILENATPEGLLEMIKEAYAKTQSLGAAFYFMEYGDDFARTPAFYPQLNELFWSFIKEEFQLAILGVFYKAHYDPQFVFTWDELTRLAAQKLRQIHGAMLEHGAKN